MRDPIGAGTRRLDRLSSPPPGHSPPHRGNPAIAGDLADPDFDGLANITEYWLNLDPMNPNGAPFAAATHPYPEGDRLRVFLQRDPARNDVTIEVQAASDLAGPWATVAASILGAPFTGAGYFGGDSATPGVKTVEIRDTMNVTETPRRFVRVRATR